MQQILNLLDQFSTSNILCIGDVMLDRFIYGKVERISPEAPIPIMKFDHFDEMIGGAGNVINNLVSLGVQAHFMSVLGKDQIGHKITELADEKIGDLSLLWMDDKRRSTLKKRFIAGTQHLLRVDEEDSHNISPEVADHLIAYASQNIKSIDLIILSDYAKGVLTSYLCQRIIELARTNGVGVLVDPKGADYEKYRGATLITPNLSEASAAFGRSVYADDEIVEAARFVQKTYGIQNVLVTRSEKGMTLVSEEATPIHLPTKAREIFDVSGAGDTVVSTLAACMSVGMELSDAAHLANIAGGLVVEKVGTATISLEELSIAMQSQEAFSHALKIHELGSALDRLKAWRQKGYKIGFTNGCFDLLHPGHVHLIRQSRKECDRLILALNTDASIKRLKGQSRPIQNETARALVLSSLADVDMILFFEEDTPMSLIEAIRPDVLIKGADYTIEEVVGADFVQQYGGRIALVPLQIGHSTTSMVQKIAINQ